MSKSVKVVIIGLLSSVLTLAGCGNKPTPTNVLDRTERPAWVLSPPRSASVVYGVGGAPMGQNEATSLQQARNAATVDMLQNLQVSIRSDALSEVSQTNTDAAETQFRQSITSVVPDITIEDTRLEQTWESPQGFIYALVSLDTTQAARRQANLYQADREILNSQNPAAQATTWAQYQTWHRKMSTLGKMSARNDLHQFLVRRPVDAGWANLQADVQQQFSDFQSGLSMAYVAQDNLAAQSQGDVVQMFAQQGIGFASAVNAAWTLTVSMASESQAQQNIHYEFVTATMSITDELGVVRWQANETRRGSAGGPERALRQGISAVLDAVRADFVGALD